MRVSVCVISYNHEEYIEQAINSILAQETNFQFEIVVSDDCSRDRTYSIIERLHNLFPDKIRILKREKNIGMMQNFMSTLEACEGDYVAICEGDDYWTDIHKLQIQADFLDKHSDYAICCHNGVIVEDKKLDTVGILYDSVSFNPPDTGTLLDLSKGNYLSTLTCMYRNTFGPFATPRMPFPSWFSELSVGDYSLHLLMARFGCIKYLPLKMAAYRMHSGGAWSMQSELNRAIKMYDSLQLAKSEFDSEVKAGLERQQRQYLASIAELANSNPDFNFEHFLYERKEGIPEVIADQIVPLTQDYFLGKRCLNSFEYRISIKLMRPLRLGIDWIRKRQNNK